MPDFIAVQCYQCDQFQVSQKRKDSKFSCKICAAKQSVRKIFAISDRAADVRKLVQQLNLTRGLAEEQYEEMSAMPIPKQEHPSHVHHEAAQLHTEAPKQLPLAQSRWQQYAAVVAAPNVLTPGDGDTPDAEDQVVTRLPDANRWKTRGTKRHRSGERRRGREEPTRGVEDTAERPVHRKAARKIPDDQALGSEKVTSRWGFATAEAPSTFEADDTRSKLLRWGLPLQSARSQSAPYKHRAVAARHPSGSKSDGLLTSIAGDEVVQDDVMY